MKMKPTVIDTTGAVTKVLKDWKNRKLEEESRSS